MKGFQQIKSPLHWTRLQDTRFHLVKYHLSLRYINFYKASFGVHYGKEKDGKLLGKFVRDPALKDKMQLCGLITEDGVEFYSYGKKTECETYNNLHLYCSSIHTINEQMAEKRHLFLTKRQSHPPKIWLSIMILTLKIQTDIICSTNNPFIV